MFDCRMLVEPMCGRACKDGWKYFVYVFTYKKKKKLMFTKEDLARLYFHCKKRHKAHAGMMAPQFEKYLQVTTKLVVVNSNCLNCYYNLKVILINSKLSV